MIKLRFRELSSRRLSVSMIALAAAQIIFSPHVVAAEAAADQVTEGEYAYEDIIVTARAREENLYEAPLSITSISAAEIERHNLKDISDLSQVAPGFFYTPQVTFNSSRLTPAIRFRGMTIPRNDPLEQLGGIFIDGVYLFGGAQSLTFDDVQRVEVIKGPQSALFGRGTFSGAVNFITREPSDTLRGRVSAGVETRDSHQFAASLEGPLADGLSFRVSGSSNKRGAHYRTTDGGGLGREQSDVINAQLVWRPTDGLRLRLRHSEVWLDDSRNLTANLNANRAELANAPGRCSRGPNPAIFFFCGALPTADQLPHAAISAATSLVPPRFAQSVSPNILSDILNNNLSNPLIPRPLPYIDKTPHLDHQGMAGRFNRTSFEIDYDFGNGIIANLVAAKSRMAATSANVSTDDSGFSAVVSTNIMTDKSVDFRLQSNGNSALTWLVGANYFKQRSVGGISGTGATVSVVTPTPPSTTQTIQYNPPAVYSGQGEVEFYSGYFALGYAFADWISLDLESRYQVDKATTSFQLPTAETSTYKMFTPRAILTLKPAEDLTIYSSWARGALRGTTNSNFALLSPDLQAAMLAIPGYKRDVPVETVDSYEIGVKQILGDFRYTLAAYYMDWQNLKNTVYVVCPNNICGPDNFGSFAPAVVSSVATVRGVEVEANWRVTPNWEMGLTFDYVRARYKRLEAPLARAATGQTDASGKTPNGFPGKQASFTTTYRDNIDLFNGDWSWFLRGEANYTGRIYVDEINQAWINDKVRVNLRAGLEGENKRLEFYVENLFNNKDWISAVRASTASGVGFGAISQPTAFAVLPRLRTFGIRAAFNF